MRSNIRPNKIFTADKNIILYKVGSLNDEKIKEVEDRIIEIFTGASPTEPCIFE